MVALDFPDAPTVGQVFDKWTWNGSGWVLTSGWKGLGTHLMFAAANMKNVTPTAAQFPLQDVIRNEAGMHDPATGTFLCNKAGWHAVTAHAMLNYNYVAASSLVVVEVRVDGAVDHNYNLRQQFHAGVNVTDFNLSGEMYLTVGQRIGLWLSASADGANVTPHASNATAQPTHMRVVVLA